MRWFYIYMYMRFCVSVCFLFDDNSLMKIPQSSILRMVFGTKLDLVCTLKNEKYKIHNTFQSFLYLKMYYFGIINKYINYLYTYTKKNKFTFVKEM